MKIITNTAVIILATSSFILNTLTVSAMNAVSNISDRSLAPTKDANSVNNTSALKVLLSNTKSLLVMNAKSTATTHAIILYTTGSTVVNL